MTNKSRKICDFLPTFSTLQSTSEQLQINPHRHNQDFMNYIIMDSCHNQMVMAMVNETILYTLATATPGSLPGNGRRNASHKRWVDIN